MIGRVLVFPQLLLLMALAYFAVSAFIQDVQFTELETEVSFWGRGSYQPVEEVRSGVDQGIQNLLGMFPDDSRVLALRASQYAWEAYWEPSIAQRQHFGRAALQTQFASQRLRPAYGQGWSKLLQYQAVDVQGQELHAVAKVQLQNLKSWQ